MTTVKDIIDVADKFCEVWKDIKPILLKFKDLDVSRLQMILGMFGLTSADNGRTKKNE